MVRDPGARAASERATTTLATGAAMSTVTLPAVTGWRWDAVEQRCALRRPRIRQVWVPGPAGVSALLPGHLAAGFAHWCRGLQCTFGTFGIRVCM